MFLTFNKDKCPLCGTLGEESSIRELNHCPRCGAKFNEFGVVLTEEKSLNIYWA